MHGLPQRQIRRDFLAVLSHTHFILGQTNFMVGSPQRKWDRLPSRFIGMEGTFGQQGIPSAFTV